MRREVKIFIEAELRDYPRTKRELEEAREDIASASPGPPDGLPRARRNLPQGVRNRFGKEVE